MSSRLLIAAAIAALATTSASASLRNIPSPSLSNATLRNSSARTVLLAREAEPGDDRGRDRRKDDKHKNKGKDDKNHFIARQSEPRDDRGHDRTVDDKNKNKGKKGKASNG